VPRYDLPKATDGSEQWMDLKDRTDITRKELRATRVAFDADGGMVEKMESHTETVLASCLVNWQVHARSGDPIPRPQSNVKELRRVADALPLDTWLAIEKAINGENGDGGYTRDCLEESKPDESGEDPQLPSTG
jgi:hypothetical protein